MTLSSQHPRAVALLRLALGFVFVAHAWLKVGILTWAQTLEFFSKQGFPAWTAYPVFAIEALGGLALIVGWATRPAVLALIPIAIGAWIANFSNGWRFSAPGGGWEYNAFLLIALVVQYVLGSGSLRLAQPRSE